MIVPPCHNRAPAAEGVLTPTGRFVKATRGYGFKPVYRFRPRWFVDRCTMHDAGGIGPNGETYPQAHAWNCAGCRWLPTHLRRAYRFTNEQLAGMQQRQDELFLDVVHPTWREEVAAYEARAAAEDERTAGVIQALVDAAPGKTVTFDLLSHLSDAEGKAVAEMDDIREGVRNRLVDYAIRNGIPVSAVRLTDDGMGYRITGVVDPGPGEPEPV